MLGDNQWMTAQRNEVWGGMYLYITGKPGGWR